MPPGDNGETLRNSIYIDVNEALRSLEELQANILKYKKTIKDIADETQARFDRVAEAIKRAAKISKEAALEELATKGPPQGMTISDAQRQIAQKYTQDLKAITFAVSELNKEQQKAGQSGQTSFATLVQSAQAYKQRIIDLQNSIRQLAQQSGVSLQTAAQVMKDADVAPANQINTALKQMTDTSAKAGQGLMSLGNVAKFVFGAVLGLSVVSILRDVVRWLGEAAQAGYEFSKAMFQMEVGVRALQRSGIEITIKDVYENIDRLRERFRIFTTKELVVGSAAFLNLVRDMGFTKDQIFELQNAIATLAVVNGRAMDDVQRTVALALSSGYTEGLQRLGVSINRVNIAQKANTLGFKGGYMALTEQQRALATYILILEKTAKYQDDLVKYQETLTGQIDVTTASIQEQKNALGLLLQPITLLTKKYELFYLSLVILLNPILIFVRALMSIPRALQFVIDAVKLANPGLYDLIHETLQSGINILKNVANAFTRLGSSVGDLLEKITGGSDKLKNYVDLAKKYYEDLLKIWTGKPMRGEVFEEPVGADEVIDSANEQKTNVEKAYEDIANAIIEQTERAKNRERDIWIDYNRDIEKTMRDFFRDVDEAYEKYAIKLADIQKKANRAVEDENAAYATRVQKVMEDTTRDRAEREQRYRDKELEAERKFQEKMRQLRENFLLALEDAVRERDALQIVRLTRRYNLEKKQAEREEEIRKESAARDQERERKELENRRADRLRELEIEHQERLRQIGVQAGRERSDAAANYNLELADLKKSLKDKKAERDISRQEQLADLRQDTKDRLAELASGFQEEYNLTEAEINKIIDLLESKYGPGGEVDAIYTGMINRLVEQRRLLMESLDEEALSGKTIGKDRPKQEKKGDIQKGEESRPNKTSNIIQDDIERENRLVESGLEDQNQIRRTKAEDQADDLELAKDERLIIVSEGMDEEYRLIEEKSNLIVELLNRYFGPGGAVDAIYQGLLARIISIFNTIVAYIIALSSIRIGGQAGSSSGGTTPRSGGGSEGGGSATSFAEGGTLIANRPTKAIFGEIPEIVNFRPLNRRGANIDRTFGSAPAGMKVSGNGGGKGVIEVRLSEGLEANIIDNALGEFAEIVISTQKRRI